jgi:hypothetical protein
MVQKKKKKKKLSESPSTGSRLGSRQHIESSFAFSTVDCIVQISQFIVQIERAFGYYDNVYVTSHSLIEMLARNGC